MVSEASSRLKCILDQLKDYQRLLDQRNNLLFQSLDYFNSAKSANSKLDQLESQVKEIDKQSARGVQNMVDSPTHGLESILQQLDQIVMDVLGQGKSLINQATDKNEGTLGIRESMLQIENRANNLRSNCQLKHSQVHP